MNIKILEKFEVLNSEMLASVEGGKKVVSMGNGMYCYDGTLKCWSNPSEIWSIEKSLSMAGLTMVHGFLDHNLTVEN